MQSTQAIATPLPEEARSRAKSLVRKNLEELRSLEKERNAILARLQQTLSSERAQYERRVIEQLPFNPIRYE